MNCDIPVYDFCTRKGNTVFAKHIKIDQAQDSWEIEMIIYSTDGVILKHLKESKGITRINVNEWQIDSYLETGHCSMKYKMLYKITDDNIVRDFLTGKIIIK